MLVLVSTLVALNLALLSLCVAQQVPPARARGELPVLRGRALEIVDTQGRVRASISVLPPSRSTSGEEQSETVLLRLITEQDRPTVKVASSEPASGLSFSGPTGTKNSYLILETKGTTSSLKLRNEDGREQVLTIVPRSSVATDDPGLSLQPPRCDPRASRASELTGEPACGASS